MDSLPIKFWLHLSALLLLLNSCQYFNDRSTNLSNDVVASVNGVEINVEEFQQENIFFQNYIPNIRNLKPENKVNFESSILNQMINEEVIYQAAITKGYNVSDVELSAATESATSAYPGSNIQAWIDDVGISIEFWRKKMQRSILIQKYVEAEVYQDIVVSNEEAQQYYTNNPKQFQQSKKRVVQHLQVRSIDVANLVQREIKRGRPFSQLIDIYSVAIDRHNQGNLGEIERNFLPEIFSREIFELKKDRKYTKLIESPYGYHIFKVLDSVPARKKTFEEAFPEISRFLTEEKSRLKFNKWFEQLKTKAEIVINNKVITAGAI